MEISQTNQFSQFVNSLSRLYKSKRLSDKTLQGLLENGKITQVEYEYIISSSK